MNWPTIGRTILGLAGGLLIGYLLSRGVYVGSASMPNNASGLLVYEKRCLYLRFNGVNEVRINPGLTEEDTQRTFCPVLGN
jgi:hypothetical protein